MGVFALSDGSEFVMEGHDGKYLRVLVARNYPGGEKPSKEMLEKYKNSSDLRVEFEEKIID